MIFIGIYWLLFSVWLSLISTASILGQTGYSNLDMVTEFIFYLGFWPSMLVGLVGQELSKFIFRGYVYAINVLGWELLGILFVSALSRVFNIKNINLIFGKLIVGLILGNFLSLSLIGINIITGGNFFNHAIGFIVGPMVLLKLIPGQAGAIIVSSNIYYVILSTYLLIKISAKEREKTFLMILVIHMLCEIIGLAS